jgi:NADH-quinone oxidoreductase subunit I
VIGLGRGFAFTLGQLFRPSINQRYPQAEPELPERSRGSVAMVFGEGGEMLCRACGLCERECPDDALIVEVEKPAEGGGRTLVSMRLDLGRCMLCGLCVESCPAGSLAMTSEFEHDTPDRRELLHVLYGAGEPPPRSPGVPVNGAARPTANRSREDAK